MLRRLAFFFSHNGQISPVPDSCTELWKIQVWNQTEDCHCGASGPKQQEPRYQTVSTLDWTQQLPGRSQLTKDLSVRTLEEAWRHKLKDVCLLFHGLAMNGTLTLKLWTLSPEHEAVDHWWMNPWHQLYLLRSICFLNTLWKTGKLFFCTFNPFHLFGEVNVAF